MANFFVKLPINKKGRIFSTDENGDLHIHVHPFGLSEDELLKFLRFGLVGISNSLVDLTVFCIMFYALDVNTYICQGAAFVISTFNSYVWNRKFTFHTREKMFGIQLVMFYILNVITFSISLCAMYFFYGVVGIHEIIAKVCVGPFVFSANYLGNRFIVFSTKKSRSKREL